MIEVDAATEATIQRRTAITPPVSGRIEPVARAAQRTEQRRTMRHEARRRRGASAHDEPRCSARLGFCAVLCWTALRITRSSPSCDILRAPLQIPISSMPRHRLEQLTEESQPSVWREMELPRPN